MGRAERLYRRELRQAQSFGEPLSRGREKTAKEIPQPLDYIVAATTSKRRISLIKHAFPGTPIEALPLGEGEPESSSPQRVVIEKLRRGKAEHQERTRRGSLPKGKSALIVADTLSGTLMLNRKHVPILRYRSKPADEAEVQKVFQDMAIASEYGEEPYYTVFSASGVSFLPTNGRADIVAPHPLVSVLYLDPDRVKYYSTPEGFEEYKRQFDQLYSSQTYTNGGEFDVVELTHLAAGLSVPVLTRNGAITRINNAERGSEEFQHELRSALSVAAAGIDPVILDAVVPGASERVNTWPFLDRLTGYSMGEPLEALPAKPRRRRESTSLETTVYTSPRLA